MGEVIIRPHSPISGSRIVRFLACPTSFYKTEKDLIDTSPKTAAIEGERAHDLAEKTLLEGESALEGCRNKLMIEGARIYSTFIRSMFRDISHITTERFVCMGDSFGFAEDSYIGGYYDALGVDRGRKLLWVFDYKFGFHVVEPNTPQLTFYILAILLKASKEIHLEFPIWKDEICEYIDTYYKDWTFKQTIVQPKRKDEAIHTYELSVDELKEFVRKMCDAVEIYQDNQAFDDSTCHGNKLCQYCEKRLFCKKSPVYEDEGIAFVFDTK